jgi:hypothetical protein
MRWTVLFLLALIIPLAAAVAPAADEGVPAIRVDRMDYDFGTVREGQVVSHLFPFRNAGSAPLEITEIKPGCGCTQIVMGLVPEGGGLEESGIEWKVRRFPPGSHGVAKFVYDTKNRRGDTGSSADILTNDPGNRRIHLVVRANIKVSVEVLPNAAGFGFVSADSKPAQTIHIKANEEPGFEIRETTSSDPRVQLKLSRNSSAPPDVVAYVLQVALDLEGLEPGDRIQDTVRVRTNSRWKPEIEIPVSAVLKPPIYVTPEVVRLVQRRKEGNPTGYLIVVNGGESDAEVVDIRSDIPDLDLQSRNLGNGRRQVVAELKSNNAPEEIKGAITIQTTHPSVKEIKVPVTYTPVRRP